MNPILENATKKFVAAALTDGEVDKDFVAVAQNFHDQASGSNEKEVLEAIRMLAAVVAQSDSIRSAFVAQNIGALVEHGFDSEPLVEPLVQRIRQAVRPARQFFDACMSELSEDEDLEEERMEEVFTKKAEEMPEKNRAWEGLIAFYLPAIAVFSLNAKARRSALDLLPDLAVMAHMNEGAHWLFRILQVLDDEPYVAIEPSTDSGIIGKMTGISDNFQLNVLLMSVFPTKGMFAKRRVSREAEQVARGTGPQQTGENIQGQWNLYTYEALDNKGQLPAENNFGNGQDWIWNEGVPADIPVFDGHRVILLGPPSYNRSWGSQRDFASLKADLTVERKLSPQEIRTWLQKMSAAAKNN